MGRLKVLITGANGLLGRNVLTSMGIRYEIHAIVRSMPNNPIPNVKYYEYDLKQDWTTDELPDRMDAIFHFAQSNRFRDFPEHTEEVFNVNVSSTVKLLDYGRKAGISKFVFTSTGGLYDSSIGEVNENSPINTFGSLGNYFATKFCSEILTHNYTKYFDISILRIFFMYGAGQQRSMLLPRLVDNVLLGRTTNLSGDEGIKINPIHVSDVVKLLEKLLSSTGSYIFNVAGPEVLSLKQIAEIIAKKTGQSPIFEYNTEPSKDCIANIDLLKSSLFEPIVKFEHKVEELINQ